jgi:parvulin-like peptidyl-prolyl isomerase
VPSFRDAVLDADIGAIVGPVESQFGYHIIQVRAREDREVEGNTREQIRQSEFQEWLEGYREENEENITISNNWPDYLPAQ